MNLVSSSLVDLTHQCASQSRGRLVKAQVPGLNPKISDSKVWGLGICIPIKLPGNAAVTGSGTTL